MTRCRTIADSGYSRHASVNCDCCRRSGIHNDPNCFQHCYTCNHDLCASCYLNACDSTEGDVPDATVLELSTFECEATFRPGTPAWLALDQIVCAAKDIIDDPLCLETDLSLAEWAVSLIFVVAVLRQSLSDILVVVDVIRSMRLPLKPEVHPFLTYLTGPLELSVKGCSDEVIVQTLCCIVNAVSCLDAYFPVTNITELRALDKILSQGSEYLCSTTSARDSTHCMLLTAALKMIANCFDKNETMQGLKLQELVLLKQSPLMMEMMEKLSCLIAAPHITATSHKDIQTDIIELYIRLLDFLVPTVEQRFGSILIYLKKHQDGSITDTQTMLLVQLFKSLSCKKMAMILSDQNRLEGEQFVESAFVDFLVEVLKHCQTMLLEILDEVIESTSYTPGVSLLYSELVHVAEKALSYVLSLIISKDLSTEDQQIRYETWMKKLVIIASLLIGQAEAAVTRACENCKISNGSTINAIACSSHVALLLPYLCSTIEIFIRQACSRKLDIDIRLLQTLLNDVISISGVIQRRVDAASETLSIDFFNYRKTVSAPILDVPRKSMLLSWDLPSSNITLEFSDCNRKVMRRGSESCYPAAFVAIPSDQFELTCILTVTDSASNWLTFGICQKSFKNSSSDGIGRTSTGVNSWGVADDRSDQSNTANFYSNGLKCAEAPRKLQRGDCLLISGILSQGWVQIDVSNPQYPKFSYRFENIVGDCNSLFIAATLANDHQLSIEAMVLSELKAVIDDTEFSSRWLHASLGAMASLADNILLSFLEARARVEPNDLAWVDYHVFSNRLTIEMDDLDQSRDHAARKYFTDFAANRDVESIAKVINIMKSHVVSCRGGKIDINLAVYSTCMALVWHCGLATELLALDEGTTILPSASLKKAWEMGQLVRLELGKLVADDESFAKAHSSVCISRACSLLAFSPAAFNFNRTLCDEVIQFVIRGPPEDAYALTISRCTDAAAKLSTGLVIVSELLEGAESIGRRRVLLLCALTALWSRAGEAAVSDDHQVKDGSLFSLDRRCLASAQVLELQRGLDGLRRVVVGHCLASLRGIGDTVYKDHPDHVTLTLAALEILLFDLHASNAEEFINIGVLDLLEIAAVSVAHVVRTVAMFAAEVLAHCLIEAANTKHASAINKLAHLFTSKITIDRITLLNAGTKASLGVHRLFDGMHLCSPYEEGLAVPFFDLPSTHCLSFWIWLPTCRSSGLIIHKGITNLDSPWSFLAVSLSENMLHLIIEEGNSVRLNALILCSLLDETWYHFAYSIDVELRIFTAYVNGKSVKVSCVPEGPIGVSEMLTPNTSIALDLGLPDCASINSSLFYIGQGPISGMSPLRSAECILGPIEIVSPTKGDHIASVESILALNSFGRGQFFHSAEGMVFKCCEAGAIKTAFVDLTDDSFNLKLKFNARLGGKYSLGIVRKRGITGRGLENDWIVSKSFDVGDNCVTVHIHGSNGSLNIVHPNSQSSPLSLSFPKCPFKTITFGVTLESEGVEVILVVDEDHDDGLGEISTPAYWNVGCSFMGEPINCLPSTYPSDPLTAISCLNGILRGYPDLEAKLVQATLTALFRCMQESTSSNLSLAASKSLGTSCKKLSSWYALLAITQC
jgi:hypothetical protein